MSPQVMAVVDGLGLETLPREGDRLNPETGAFKSEARRPVEQRGGRLVPTSEQEALPVKQVAARLTGGQAQSENARFHGEHESVNRPEYTTAVNNFMRLLHASASIHPDPKQRIAERFIEHAEKEGTLSAPVLEVLNHTRGPESMAAAEWRLDPRT